jgi:uncharacterized RDD family membrane protein YckC
MSPPRYPSLRLQFDAVKPLEDSGEAHALPAAVPYEPVSHQALALNEVTPDLHENIEARPAAAGISSMAPHPPVARAGHTGAKLAGAKIIEFPRFPWGNQEPFFEPPVQPPDQLAEPVTSRPRILEVPEMTPPPPALGGITIEPSQRHEVEKRLGIDVPLQSASLARRIVASLIDGLIIMLASALFGFIFWKVASVQPPRMQILGMAVGVLLVFWAVYHYLLLVYAASTPGLQVAGLELARFNGSSTSRSLRRWRVLASYLSAASLGMGYAWVFLDEDVLCWHDRITHTYLAPRKQPARDGRSSSHS